MLPQEELTRDLGQYFCLPHYVKAVEKYMDEPCYRCEQAIKEGEGLEALGKWYHAFEGCFVCSICQEPFDDGEQFHRLPDSEDPVHKRCMT